MDKEVGVVLRARLSWRRSRFRQRGASNRALASCETQNLQEACRGEVNCCSRRRCHTNSAAQEGGREAGRVAAATV
jgi:hypothetical protein